MESSLSRFRWQLEIGTRNSDRHYFSDHQPSVVQLLVWKLLAELNPSNSTSPAITTLSEVINTASEEIISSSLKRTHFHDLHLTQWQSFLPAAEFRQNSEPQTFPDEASPFIVACDRILGWLDKRSYPIKQFLCLVFHIKIIALLVPVGKVSVSVTSQC